MTPEPLDETYFEWLAVQVVNPRLRNPRQTHWNVLRVLFTQEFVWRIHNDENRVEDGKELRKTFLATYQLDPPTPEWAVQGCSFLEMLIALSGRLAFQTEGVSPAEWFWIMLNNVQLQISDRDFVSHPRQEELIVRVLGVINNRTYDKNGKGGLFPLHEAPVDQTQTELWYQMNYYLLEGS